MKLTNICTNCQTVENEGVTTIFSYGTPVLSFDPSRALGHLDCHRLWDGHSTTTMRHINKTFLTMVYLQKLTKRNGILCPLRRLDNGRIAFLSLVYAPFRRWWLCLPPCLVWPVQAGWRAQKVSSMA